MESNTNNTQVKGKVEEESKDETDLAPQLKKCTSCTKSMNPLRKGFLGRQCGKDPVKKTSLYGDCELQNTVKTHLSALEKFHLFHFPLRKKSDPLISTEKLATIKTNDMKPEQRPKLIKSKSLARLFGNTYSTKKPEEHHTPAAAKTQTLCIEKFHDKSNNNDFDEDTTTRNTNSSCNIATNGNGNNANDVPVKDVNDNNMVNGCGANNSHNNNNQNILDPSAFHEKSNLKAIRTLTRGLSKLLRRNCDSVDISKPDSEYKVRYLGNVLTGFAKGDACVEKPLATLWRNYTSNNKPEVIMRLKVCPSGLKATTRQHGLTEYWSHRITFCSSPKNYPKVFCWIYRHEGRKLKHELRCHAVICSKDIQASDIATELKQNLAIALREFKRDKISRQNARLSLANSVYDNPSMPRRKILLSTGANNYRPPLERSKSAPKLTAIEEIVDEEEEEEENEEEAKAPLVIQKKPEKPKEEVPACCKEDFLYPSITLGRRRCRRGHSIRRSRLRSETFINATKSNQQTKMESAMNNAAEQVTTTNDVTKKEQTNSSKLISNCDNKREIEVKDQQATETSEQKTTKRSDLGSDEDFESFLLYNNYDSNNHLESDLLSYFDMKMLTPMTSITSNITAISLHDITDDNSSFDHHEQRTTLSLDNLADYQSDNELDAEDTDEIYFNQDSLLATLRRQSKINDHDGVDDDDDLHANKHFILNNKSVNIYDKTDDSYTDRSNCSSSNIFQHRRNSLNVVFHDGDLLRLGLSSTSSSPTSLIDKLDSDESSISSGCETSSTVTSNTDDLNANPPPIMPMRSGSVLDRVRSFEQLAESNHVNKEPIGERVIPIHPTKYFKRSITFPTPNGTGTCVISSGEPKDPLPDDKVLTDDSDEFSDESGYVEFQDLSLKSIFA